MTEQVPGEVDPAPLVGRILEGPPQRGHETAVLVGDGQLHPGQAALFEAEQEATAERLVLAVADVETQDFPCPVGGDPGGDHDRHRHDLAALAGLVADVEVGRIQVDVRERRVVQRPGAERADRRR